MLLKGFRVRLRFLFSRRLRSCYIQILSKTFLPFLVFFLIFFVVRIRVIRLFKGGSALAYWGLLRICSALVLFHWFVRSLFRTWLSFDFFRPTFTNKFLLSFSTMTSLTTWARILVRLRLFVSHTLLMRNFVLASAFFQSVFSHLYYSDFGKKWNEDSMGRMLTFYSQKDIEISFECLNSK